jgi:hypothetical protein
MRDHKQHIKIYRDTLFYLVTKISELVFQKSQPIYFILQSAICPGYLTFLLQKLEC